MSEPRALQKLLTWLSPAFPVGGFAWSAGLETAIAERAVTDSASMQNWLSGTLSHGSLHTDAILLAHAHRQHHDAAELRQLADLCLALAPAAERHAELCTTGQSFVIAAAAWPAEVLTRLPDPCPYPIALGAIAAAHDVALLDMLLGYLTASASAQVSVAVRLVPLGQSEALRILAALEPLISTQAASAAIASLEELGSIAYAADIAQLRHETIEPRLFRS
jgi:urease accessory protein